MHINDRFDVGTCTRVRADYKPSTTNGPTLEITDKKISTNNIQIVFNTVEEVKKFAGNLLKAASNDSFPIIE